MLKKILPPVFAVWILLFTACPDATTGLPSTPSAGVVDAVLYEKLEGGWEVTEHGNGFLAGNEYMVFTDDHCLEYYKEDLNRLSWISNITILESNSITLNNWDHSYSYEFSSPSVLKLWNTANPGQYLLMKGISDAGKINSRKGLQASFNTADNPTLFEEATFQAVGGNLYLFLPEECNPSTMVPEFILPGECSVMPDDSGKVTDFSSPRNYQVTAEDGSKEDYTVTVIQPDKNVNMLVNGDLSKKGLFWWEYNDVDHPEMNYCYFDSNEAHAVIGSPHSDRWRYQVGYSAKYLYTLEYGSSYQVSFKAKASSDRTIQVQIIEDGRDLNNDGYIYTTCFDADVPLTDAYQTFSYSLIWRYPADNNPSLKFIMGDQLGEVWIDDVVLKKVDNLPATITYQEDGEGYIQYFTCDASLYGNTWWNYYWQTEGSPFPTLEVEYVKKSGSYWPAGVIFNHRDDSNFCHLQVFTDGRYSIVEKYQNHNTTLVGKTHSDLFNTGLNVVNKIKIVWNNSTDSFDFYANDSFLVAVPLAEFPSGRNWGKAGFISAIGTATVEDFPIEPADFRYKMLQPVAIP